MIVYRRQGSSGCGGCLLIGALILLAMGGAPLLLNVLGFLLASGLFTILALIAIFRFFIYYARRQAKLYERSQTESHNLFVFLLVRILVRIAQLDGTITKAEIGTITNFFRIHLRYTQSQLYWVKDLINEATTATEPLEGLLAEFKSRFAYEPRLILLELVYQVLFTNERVRDEELAVLQRIADYLDIAPYDHQTIRARYMARSREGAAREERYYEILGLSPGATFEEIKAAYRKLSMQYHPDKVNHLGEEFRRVAEEKMKELNEAYQFLKKKFGQ